MTRPLFRPHRLDHTFKQAIRLFIPTIIFFITSFNGVCQIVNIPDANFKNYLLNNTSINTNGDGEIQVAEATGFAGIMDIQDMSIYDLTGIEAFTALNQLNCYHNYLTSLDISANTALTTLSCSYNSLTSLDISANTALINLDCWNNPLTSLDVSANAALTTLWCSFNSLTSLDVSANTALTWLYCGYNSITSLDVSANTALTYLGCFNNSLTSLDVSANTALSTLYCRYNSLTSLDVSANTALIELDCRSNSLTSLDVSANTALNYLHCSNNSLASLNVQNGNNINFYNFYATDNPDLACIIVDNAAWSTANWTAPDEIDSTAGFAESEICNVGIEEENNPTFTFYPNPATTNLTIETELLSNTSILIEIKNTLGQTVYTFNEKTNSGIYKKTIDINLGQGIYYLTLQTNEGLMTKGIEIIK